MSGFNGGAVSTSFVKPLYVRLSVPARGLGSELDAIVQFHLERGEELRTGGLKSPCRSTGLDYLLLPRSEECERLRRAFWRRALCARGR
jgi:hypothetical protein